MAITRRPHTRVDKRLYRFDDTGEYFVVVAGMLGRSGKRLHQHLVRLGACSLNQARVRRDEIYAEVDAGTYRKETTHTVPTVGEKGTNASRKWPSSTSRSFLASI